MNSVTKVPMKIDTAVCTELCTSNTPQGPTNSLMRVLTANSTALMKMYMKVCLVSLHMFFLLSRKSVGQSLNRKSRRAPEFGANFPEAIVISGNGPYLGRNSIPRSRKIGEDFAVPHRAGESEPGPSAKKISGVCWLHWCQRDVGL